MKSKTTTLLLLICFLFTGFFASAQQGELVLHTYQIKQHAKAISLTAEQTEQISQLEKNYENAINELYTFDSEQTEPDYAALQEQAQTLQEKLSTDLSNVITEKQIAQIQTLQEEQLLEFEIQEHNNRRNYYTTGDWLDIGLSEEQIEAIIEAEDKFNEDVIHNPQNLNENSPTIQKVYEEHLTEEQFTTYLANIEARKNARVEKTLAEMDRFIPVIEGIKLYFEEESFPKYQVLRSRLDTKISAPDRVFIESIRASFKRAFDNSFREKMGRGPVRLDHPEVKQRMDQLQNAFSTIIEMYTVPATIMLLSDISPEIRDEFTEEELKELASKYDADIVNLSEELTTLRTADFNKEIELLSKVLPESEAKEIASDINLIDGKRSRIQMQKEDVKLLRNLAFLLIPFENNKLDNDNPFDNKESFRVYPSPSNGQHNLELNLMVEDKIKVELLDQSGKTIQIAHNNTLPEGKHVLSFNWSHIDGTIFYYRIIGKHGVETLKFVISK